MSNIFEAQDTLFDAHPTPYRSTADAKRRKAQQCERRCTGSRWAAIVRGEAARHAEDQRMRNGDVGRAPRAAAALASLAPSAAQVRSRAPSNQGSCCG